jgi:lipoprotein NlpD
MTGPVIRLMILRLVAGLAALALAACASKQSAPVIERTPAPAAKPAAKPAAPAAPATTGAPAQAGPDFYTVKRGDTLYGIALDHGQDYKDIAAWNNLADPNLIRVGQVLRVTPPPATTTESGVVVRPVAPSGAGAPAASGPRTEPNGAKKPYSDEAWAQAQRGETVAAAPAAKPAPKPEAKPEPKPEPKPAAEPARPAEGDEVAWAWPLSGKVIGQFSESGANKGVDIAAKVGDPVLAAGPGRVVYAGQGLRGYGRLVIIKHNNTYLSAYAHNSTLLVKEGQTVTRGQKIAEAGNTDSDVPKLHFEIRRQGKPVDPVKLLPEAR